ncbi:MAG: CC0125/CC1285 family lipoprotein [Oceanococcus sp.]
MKTMLLALLATLILTGCNTKYGEMGGTGGVAAAAITNDTYRISARGNGYTNSTTIQDYSMLKAAEVTLAAGKSHFAILSGSDATSQSQVQTAGTFNTSFIGNSAFTTYNPGSVYDVVKPGEDLMIRIFTPTPGQAMPSNVFPAQEVFNNINPRVERSGK